VLYDAKNNKKSPGTSTSLPREAGLEHPCSARRRCLARLVRDPAVGPSAVQISIIKKVFYHD
jgi:hypothetical protein